MAQMNDIIETAFIIFSYLLGVGIGYYFGIKNRSKCSEIRTETKKGYMETEHGTGR